jgi:hypothetical protein
MENFISEYKQTLKNHSLDILRKAFINCKPEILYDKKEYVKVLVPYYFYDYISPDKYFKFSDYEIEIGYEDAIIIFDIRNPFINKYVYKYELKSKYI